MTDAIRQADECMNTCRHADASAFLASIVESSDDAIVGKSLDGIVLSWNRAAQKIFGYTAAEMIGRPMAILFPPERAPEEDLFVTAVCRGEQVGHYDTIRVRKDGVRIQVSVNVSWIRDRVGVVIGVSSIARDITFREMAREKQARYDRAIELLNQKEVLLEEMQHRVLNSLQMIGSILLLKARSVTGAEAKSELQDAYRRVISVASVQRHLHDSGRGGLVEVSSYMTKLCNALTESMIGSNHMIKLRVDVSAGEVSSADATSLGLIVAELVINALKYAFPIKHRSGEIIVSYEATGAEWKLIVSDNGVGCSLSQQSPRVGGGLGRRLVSALARQLDAEMELRTGTSGTSVAITHAMFKPLADAGGAPPQCVGAPAMAFGPAA